MESWLPIVGYDGKYEVSDFGNVKNVKTGRILKPSTNKNGYCQICLFNKCNKTCYVHRLVLLAFLPIEEVKEVNHKNHIKTDNRLEKFEWCKHSENNRFRQKREGTSSQYIGVCWHKSRNKWLSSCQINGKKIHLGNFDDEHDAGKAYNDFVIKHDLQFVILNII
jgi:hypothetical protein